ncbi:MAG TPA: YoaK family protein [Acetobacteraceae bacterium]
MPGRWRRMVWPEAKGPTVSVPSVHNTHALQALLVVLSVTAGCTDVISFLGLHGLFTAHITGNLVVLAAHIATGIEAQISQLLSVPVFIVMISLTILLADGLEAIGLASLCPLLLLQFLLLAAFLVLCVAIAPQADQNATNAVVAGMAGVSAMAVQNALVQVSLKEAPTTAVMTSNVTHFAVDVGKVLRGGDPADVAKARNRAARILPVIVGFAVGCGVGAACEIMLGLWSLTLPAGLALLAFAIGFAVDRDERPDA